MRVEAKLLVMQELKMEFHQVHLSMDRAVVLVEDTINKVRRIVIIEYKFRMLNLQIRQLMANKWIQG